MNWLIMSAVSKDDISIWEALYELLKVFQEIDREEEAND